MRKLSLLLLLLPSTLFGFGLVNNSGTSPEDSVSFAFYSLDSLGNPTSADSFFVLVVGPSGDSVFAEAVTASSARIDSAWMAGFSVYSYQAAVADIDGAGAAGQYAISLVAKKNSPALHTPFVSSFQVITTATITDVNMASISGDAGAADNLETMLDGTGGQTLSLGELEVTGANGGGGSFSVTNSNGPAVRYIGLSGYGLDIQGTTADISSDITGNLSGSVGSVTGSVGSVTGSVGSVTGTVGSVTGAVGSVSATVAANMVSVSGSTVAADNLEEVYDADAVGAEVWFTGVHILADGSGDTALVVRGNSAPGLSVSATGLDQHAAVFDGSADAGASMYLPDGLNGNITGNLTGTAVAADTNSLGEQIAVMPDHWTAADSAAYAGSATVDSASVARAVWNAPQLNHTTAGSFGDYLDAKVSSVSASGSGAYAVSVVAYDSSSAQVVPGAGLVVRNLSQSATIAAASSSVDGAADFNLDSDSFIVVTIAPGYLFGVYDTFVVSGPSIDTVFGYSFDPGAPSSPGLCRTFGYLASVGGVAESGVVVSAYLPKGVSRSGNLIVSGFPIETTTDSLGYFYLDLIPSDSLLGTDTRYEIAINRADGTVLRKRLTIPSSSSWQISW